MEIKLTDEEITSIRISKTFKLEVNGKEIEVHKFTIEDEYETDCDTEIMKDEHKILDSLDDDERDELDEFINELPMLK